jgi:sulfite reductase alpha subunit-like flavoprotein
MQVAVAYESRTGNTAHAARLVAGGLKGAGADVAVMPIAALDFKRLAEADVVIVGTWADGAFFFGQRPGGGGKIARLLPEIWDKRAFAFVTYAVNPGRSHNKLGDILEAKGARSLGESAFHRNRLEEDVTAFVDQVIDHFAVD